MKSGLAFGLGLILGAGGATLVAHTVLKQQYAQKADEEIAACREAFLEESAKRRKDQEAKASQERQEKAVEAFRTYSPDPENADIIMSTASGSQLRELEARVQEIEAKQEQQPKTERPKDWKQPYVIDPALFDAADNPNRILGLKYYPKEGVVTHGENDVALTMEELDNAVGREALVHFGEFGEEDRVCVRNENWGVDYEICIQPRSWEDVLKEKPWLKK